MKEIDYDQPEAGGACQLLDPDQVFRYRARRYADVIGAYLRGRDGNIHDFVIAGGALLRGPVKDVDVFPGPVSHEAFIRLVKSKNDVFEVSLPFSNPTETITVQLCPEWPGSVQKLIQAFPFSHCQVAVQCDYLRTYGMFMPGDAATTYPFNRAMVRGGTDYNTAFPYPARALTRLGRLQQKLNLTDGEVRELAKQILCHMAVQGKTVAQFMADDPWLSWRGIPNAEIAEIFAPSYEIAK